MECISGRLRPLDSLELLTPLSPEQVAKVERVRLSKGELGPTLPYARPPKTVTEATAVYGPAWWTTRTWAGMRKLHGLTLVDVPKQCKAKYADLVVQIIAEAESGEPAMLASDPLLHELAWMKLSVVDAMVLNSTRSPGESQIVAVNRRIRNFHAEQWETLWLEATRTSGSQRDKTSQLTPAERERKLAAKVEALAAAGQAKKAARAVAAKEPPITDLSREMDLQALFPKSPPRAPRAAYAPRVDRELPPGWLTAQALARTRQMEATVAATTESPNKLSKPGPMATRAEHLENLKHSEDGVERMAALIVRPALGQGPKAVVRAHATGEILAIAKPDGSMRPLIMHSIRRRIGLGAVARATQAETMAASGVRHLGVGAGDGCVKAFHATAALVELNPGKPIVSCDISVAHQSLDRAWMMREVHDLCLVLERPLAVWYPRDGPTAHWWRTSDGKVVDIPASNGLDQGCLGVPDLRHLHRETGGTRPRDYEG